MSNSKIVGFFLVVVFLAVLSSAATFSVMSRFCDPSSAPVGLTGDWRHWPDRVNLTEDQKKALVPLEVTLKQTIERIQPELAAARIQVCSALNRPSIDEKSLESLIVRIGDLETEQQRHVVRHLFAMKKILTPEQEQSFFTMVMQSVCEQCRRATGSHKDYCGHCNAANRKDAR